MIGAGIGIGIDSGGAAFAASGALIGAGIGSASESRLFSGRARPSVAGFVKGGVVGGVSGAVGGYATGAAARIMAPIIRYGISTGGVSIANPLVGSGIGWGASVGAGAFATDITSQGINWARGNQNGINTEQLYCSTVFGISLGFAAPFVAKGVSDISSAVRRRFAPAQVPAETNPAHIPLEQRYPDIPKNALVHFSPQRHAVIKPSVSGKLYAFLWDNIKHLSPKKVENVIGQLAGGGEQNSAKVMHVLEASVEKAEKNAYSIYTDFPEYTLTTETKVSQAYTIQ